MLFYERCFAVSQSGAVSLKHPLWQGFEECWLGKEGIGQLPDSLLTFHVIGEQDLDVCRRMQITPGATEPFPAPALGRRHCQGCVAGPVLQVCSPQHNVHGADPGGRMLLLCVWVQMGFCRV